MKTYLNYITRLWVANFLLTFIIIDIILLIGNIVKYGSKNGFSTILPMLPFFIPAMLIYSLPISGLVATIMTIAKTRRTKEPVTLAASGISMLQLLPPFITLGLFLSILTGVCFQWLQPMAEGWKRNFLGNIGANLIEDEIKKKNAEIKIGNYTLYTFENKLGSKSMILQKRKNGSITDEIFADEANIIVNREQKTIDLQVNKIKVIDYNDDKSITGSMTMEFHKPIPIPYQEKYSLNKRYRQMALTEMWELMKDPSFQDMKRCTAYFYEKLSVLLSPLLLVLVAFPLGFVGSPDSRASGFIVGLGMIFLCYYPLLIIGKKMGLSDSMIIPIWLCLQLPNIFLILFSFIGLTRLNQKV